MIIDCFPFFNELDLLDIRLKLLDNIVDKVVLVESTRTFTLSKKKLFYRKTKTDIKNIKIKLYMLSLMILLHYLTNFLFINLKIFSGC